MPDPEPRRGTFAWWNQLLSAAKSLATIGGICGGGIWAYYSFHVLQSQAAASVALSNARLDQEKRAYEHQTELLLEESVSVDLLPTLFKIGRTRYIRIIARMKCNGLRPVSLELRKNVQFILREVRGLDRDGNPVFGPARSVKFAFGAATLYPGNTAVDVVGLQTVRRDALYYIRFVVSGPGERSRVYSDEEYFKVP